MKLELVGGPAAGSILAGWPASETIQVPIPREAGILFHHYRRTRLVRKDGTRLYEYIGSLGGN